jgi:hypothetical protein
LDPENVRDLNLRAIWNFFRRTGLLWLGSNEGAQGPVKACVQRDREGSTHIYSYSTQLHRATPQKTWVLSNSTVVTSNVAQQYIVWWTNLWIILC